MYSLPMSLVQALQGEAKSMLNNPYTKGLVLPSDRPMNPGEWSQRFSIWTFDVQHNNKLQPLTNTNPFALSQAQDRSSSVNVNLELGNMLKLTPIATPQAWANIQPLIIQVPQPMSGGTSSSKEDKLQWVNLLVTRIKLAWDVADYETV